jgi:hypothetical protein
MATVVWSFQRRSCSAHRRGAAGERRPAAAGFGKASRRGRRRASRGEGTGRALASLGRSGATWGYGEPAISLVTQRGSGIKSPRCARHLFRFRARSSSSVRSPAGCQHRPHTGINQAGSPKPLYAAHTVGLGRVQSICVLVAAVGLALNPQLAPGRRRRGVCCVCSPRAAPRSRRGCYRLRDLHRGRLGHRPSNRCCRGTGRRRKERS